MSFRKTKSFHFVVKGFAMHWLLNIGAFAIITHLCTLAFHKWEKSKQCRPRPLHLIRIILVTEIILKFQTSLHNRPFQQNKN